MLGLYKTILNNLPTAVVLVDKKMRVRFANRAFLMLFGAYSEKGVFRDYVACREKCKTCGKGESCNSCALRSLFSEARKNNGMAMRKLMVRTLAVGRLTCRFKVVPLGKYLLGIADGAYETEIARELNSAQNIQQKLLPPAKGGGTPYSFMYIPCREIGGDLPDVYEVNGQTMGFLADVSGKGISAGMLSAFVKAGWDRADSSPSRALRGLNRKFQELNLDECSYVTAAAVRVDGDGHRIFYSCAGHNAPILLKSNVGIDEIEMNAPPVSNWIPDFAYEERSIGYGKGDILVMLTDGVIESRNKKGEMFSLERVEEALRKSDNAEIFIERLKAALTEFCGTFSDDLTAIAFDLQ